MKEDASRCSRTCIISTGTATKRYRCDTLPSCLSPHPSSQRVCNKHLTQVELVDRLRCLLQTRCELECGDRLLKKSCDGAARIASRRRVPPRLGKYAHAERDALRVRPRRAVRRRCDGQGPATDSHGYRAAGHAQLVPRRRLAGRGQVGSAAVVPEGGGRVGMYARACEYTRCSRLPAAAGQTRPCGRGQQDPSGSRGAAQPATAALASRHCWSRAQHHLCSALDGSTCR